MKIQSKRAKTNSREFEGENSIWKALLKKGIFIGRSVLRVEEEGEDEAQRDLKVKVAPRMRIVLE